MTATDLSTADVLRRAKQVLIERGWAQCQYVDGRGRVCAVGALGVAAAGVANFEELPDYENSTEARRAYRRAAKWLDRVTPPSGDSIVDFNDHQLTVEPVLAVFDAAIALAESEAS